MMTTYLDYEVLLDTMDASDALTAGQASKLAIVASTVGMRRVFDKRGTPATTRTLTLKAFGQEAIAALRAFLERRRGRVVPFWLPLPSAGVIVELEAPAGATTLVARAGGSMGGAFTGARQHITVGAQRARIAAVATAGGAYALTLGSNLQARVAAGTALSFIALCRLATDDVTLEYAGPDYAEATFDVIELPNETP